MGNLRSTLREAAYPSPDGLADRIHCNDSSECQNPAKPYCSGAYCVECTAVNPCMDPAKPHCVQNTCLP